MINVICSHDNFIYDVHSLVKAFYPCEDVKVITEEKMEPSVCEGLHVFVDYKEDHSSIRIFEDNDQIICRDSEVAFDNDRIQYKMFKKGIVYCTL